MAVINQIEFPVLVIKINGKHTEGSDLMWICFCHLRISSNSLQTPLTLPCLQLLKIWIRIGVETKLMSFSEGTSKSVCFNTKCCIIIIFFTVKPRGRQARSARRPRGLNVAAIALDRRFLGTIIAIFKMWLCPFNQPCTRHQMTKSN